jgi:DNA-binding PadR family transcriptional regulator
MQLVKYGLLGLLAKEPRHGYELKVAFEELLGGSWPLNIGQVYSTLGRLERDALVEAEVVAQDPLPDRKVYSITQTGRDDLARWMDEPNEAPVRLRDDLFLKVLLQSRFAGADSRPLIARQRQIYLQALAELSALRSDDQFPRLLVEAAMLHIEADLKWLELCEDRLNARGQL